jgi:hypothetical protein
MYDETEYKVVTTSTGSDLSPNSDISQNPVSLGEMLIYSSDASVESVEFDKTIDDFNAMVRQYSAFFENSYISGMNNAKMSNNRLRDASYTIRIPKEHFQAMLDRFYELGNVLYIRTSAVNITAQFTDTNSRLATYKIEETRLLAMLEKSATVEEMLQIEMRLSEVRYEIESLTSTLRNWQNQVNYSTIDIRIQEVVSLSDSSPYPRTYAQELGYGVKSTVNTIGEFFKMLFKIIVVLSPLLLIAAIILVIVIRARRKRSKRIMKSALKASSVTKSSESGQNPANHPEVIMHPEKRPADMTGPSGNIENSANNLGEIKQSEEETPR